RLVLGSLDISYIVAMHLLVALAEQKLMQMVVKEEMFYEYAKDIHFMHKLIELLDEGDEQIMHLIPINRNELMSETI
ncbi:hypothetical protein, partial [Pseudomonas aeruginosa]|uniref:hypothetical protein n=1 Tax=Pseudomonas aeruginosa TaxID=287 RepID=UPI0039685B36